MTSDGWVRVTAPDNIPLREGRAVVIDGREFAIFNLGARFLAVDGRCPHKGGPLSDGIVVGTTVVCPLHAWKVNLETGTVERPVAVSACVHTHETKIEDGLLLIRVERADQGGVRD
jgi:nitrite reductase (NADH) small subunit